ncbi:MAG: molybdopterin-dependent oxidoreductase [Chloroflexi bacterium]|nr:molybdopterin-dependent oxidoreductase [Chloroflexota bacterium]
MQSTVPWRREFLSGAIATVALLAVYFVARFIWQIPALPEAVIESILSFIPPALFEAVIQIFGSLAKTLNFYAILIGMVGVGGLFGLLYGRLLALLGAKDSSGGTPTALLYGLGIGGLLWLVHSVTISPFVERGFFGMDASSPAIAAVAIDIIAYLAFGFVLAYVRQPFVVEDSETASEGVLSRRSLAPLAVSGLALGGAYALKRSFAAQAQAIFNEPSKETTVSDSGETLPIFQQGFEGLEPLVTPNDQFYVISKNNIDPTVDVKDWSLTITGMVDNKMILDYDALTAMPSQQQYATLQCISNAVGGDLIGCALWEGVSLWDLLVQAGIQPGVKDIVLHAADGYQESIPLEKAQDPEVLLAYRMNGAILPNNHGFPARLIVPNIYGMKNVKWLTRIEPVDHDFKGFWQQRGWSDEAIYKTMSRIDAPRNGATVSAKVDREVLIGGIAFAGNRGISKVEVRIDESDWIEAELGKVLSQLSWVQWKITWEPPVAAGYTIRVRATDGTGELQDETELEPAPNGASGWHTISSRISGISDGQN